MELHCHDVIFGDRCGYGLATMGYGGSIYCGICGGNVVGVDKVDVGIGGQILPQRYIWLGKL